MCLALVQQRLIPSTGGVPAGRGGSDIGNHIDDVTLLNTIDPECPKSGVGQISAIDCTNPPHRPSQEGIQSRAKAAR